MFVLFIQKLYDDDSLINMDSNLMTHHDSSLDESFRESMPLLLKRLANVTLSSNEIDAIKNIPNVSLPCLEKISLIGLHPINDKITLDGLKHFDFPSSAARRRRAQIIPPRIIPPRMKSVSKILIYFIRFAFMIICFIDSESQIYGTKEIKRS